MIVSTLLIVGMLFIVFYFDTDSYSKFIATCATTIYLVSIGLAIRVVIKRKMDEKKEKRTEN